MSAAVWHGGCLCGSVRFEVAGEASSCCICHCASCRAASGAPFLAWTTFASSTFSILRGALAVYRSSPPAERGFCAGCGTTLTYRHRERPADIDVTTTTLDGAARFVPDRHIWVSDKVPWLSLNDGLPQYAEWSTNT